MKNDKVSTLKKNQESGAVSSSAAVVSAHDAVAELLDWAMRRYQAEVAERPDKNIYKKTLKHTWQQVLEKLGETKDELAR